MDILYKALDMISKQDLDNLIENEIMESRFLDYKSKLPGNTSEEKKNFLSDVSAFANTAGGLLIYGIEAPDGTPLKLTPIRIENLEDTINRLEHLVRDGIAPRIHGIEFKEVKINSEDYILILKIPPSWNSPHAVDYMKRFRFYSRTSMGNQQLDVYQLRDAFLQSATVNENIKEFRKNRLSNISDFDTPVPLTAGSKLVVHIVPMDAFTLGDSLDIQRIVDKIDALDVVRYIYRHNFDGYLGYNPASFEPDCVSRSYIQVFRSGCIEFVKVLEPVKIDYKALSGTEIDQFVEDSVKSSLELLKNLGRSPPIIVMVSLLEVHNYEIIVTVDPPSSIVIRTESNLSIPYPIDRPDLLVSPQMIEEYNVDLKDVLKMVSDTIWNAAGHNKSLTYYD